MRLRGWLVDNFDPWAFAKSRRWSDLAKSVAINSEEEPRRVMLFPDTPIPQQGRIIWVIPDFRSMMKWRLGKLQRWLKRIFAITKS